MAHANLLSFLISIADIALLCVACFVCSMICFNALCVLNLSFLETAKFLLLPGNDSILISRESKSAPRNYFLTKLSQCKSEIQVTEFAHPQPDLLGVTKELDHEKRCFALISSIFK